MRIIDRFDMYMTRSGLNDNQVTLNAGLSVGLLGKARQGKSDLGKKAVEKILSYYQNLNKVWLLTGEGEMLKDVTEQAKEDASDSITMPREVFDQIAKLTETILSQQRTIENLSTKKGAVSESRSVL